MGNFLFGVFLGSTATIGFIFGLPIDIRHIAFASANFAHGLINMPADLVTINLVLISLLGVALIGLVNLLVSFSLALIVALRSKEVQFSEWGRLAKLLFTHLWTNPKDFVLPRAEPMKYAAIDSQGQMIFEEVNSKKGGKPLPTNYVIRRLSQVKVMPTSAQPKETKQTSSPDPDDKKLVVLDDGLTDTPMPDNAPTVEDKAANAKISLPKPSKPPKLPN